MLVDKLDRPDISFLFSKH